MAAQHIRRGRAAKERRQRSAKARSKAVIVYFPGNSERKDPFRPGIMVLVAELEALQA